MSILNIDHDLALSNESPYFMSPQSAVKMRCDLAILPIWFAPPSSLVMVDQEEVAKWVQEMKRQIDFAVSICQQSELDSTAVQIAPWGFNRALIYQLQVAGIKIFNPPSECYLTQLKTFSSRSFAIQIGAELNALLDLKLLHYPPAKLFLTLESLTDYVAESAPTILKAPWSGSGKGLHWCLTGFSEAAQRWSANVIKKQGGVVAEPVYNKILDFAFEFECAQKVTFVGYSIFKTNYKGAYQESFLASNAVLEKRLERYLSLAELYQIQNDLCQLLEQSLLNNYQGYLGVDMMICATSNPNQYALHPCVEINMRMNMGVVARLFFDRHCATDSQGLFAIESDTSTNLLADHLDRQVSQPLVIKEGRCVSGYLSLTPVLAETTYRVRVELQDCLLSIVDNLLE